MKYKPAKHTTFVYKYKRYTWRPYLNFNWMYLYYKQYTRPMQTEICSFRSAQHRANIHPSISISISHIIARICMNVLIFQNVWTVILNIGENGWNAPFFWETIWAMATGICEHTHAYAGILIYIIWILCAIFYRINELKRITWQQREKCGRCRDTMSPCNM